MILFSTGFIQKAVEMEDVVPTKINNTGGYEFHKKGERNPMLVIAGYFLYI
jgi:hypothetical protein